MSFENFSVITPLLEISENETFGGISSLLLF